MAFTSVTAAGHHRQSAAADHRHNNLPSPPPLSSFSSSAASSSLYCKVVDNETDDASNSGGGNNNATLVRSDFIPNRLLRVSRRLIVNNSRVPIQQQQQQRHSQEDEQQQEQMRQKSTSPPPSYEFIPGHPCSSSDNNKRQQHRNNNNINNANFDPSLMADVGRVYAIPNNNSGIDAFATAISDLNNKSQPSSIRAPNKRKLVGKVRRSFRNVSFKTVSASIQRLIAWCLGWYGYFIGRFPYIMLVLGLALGLGCASGLRHLRTTPVDLMDFVDAASSLQSSAEALSGFTAYNCGCDESRIKKTTTTTTTATTTTTTSTSTTATTTTTTSSSTAKAARTTTSPTDVSNRKPNIEEEIMIVVEDDYDTANKALANAQPRSSRRSRSLAVEANNGTQIHRFSCANPINYDKGCHCSWMVFAFEDIDREKIHGFIDLNKFQKLLKVEEMVWNFSAGPVDPLFTARSLCRRHDKRNSLSGCVSVMVSSVDSAELRSVLAFNMLPFPYTPTSLPIIDLIGDVKTTVSSNGDTWATSARVIRTSLEMCHVSTDEAHAVYRTWNQAFRRNSELENSRYFEPKLGISIRYHFPMEVAQTAEATLFSLVPKFLATIVAVGLWAVAAMSGSDFVTSKPWLGLIGVTSTLLANAGGIGLMAYLGRDFNQGCACVPFLTLAIGLDDMFALSTSMQHTRPTDPLPIRMKQTMSEAGSAIFITFLTNLVAQSIGTRTPFRFISEFSTFSLVCMVFDFILQLTIFCPSLALLSMMEPSGRNACCCCAVMPKRDKRVLLSKSPCSIICCSRIDFENQKKRAAEALVQPEEGGGTHQSTEEDGPPAGSALMRFVRAYACLLVKTPMRYLVLVLYCGYLAVTCYGFSQLSIGFKAEHFVSFKSPDYKYLKLNREAFLGYRLVDVMFNRELDFTDPTVRSDIETIFRKLTESGFFDSAPGMNRFWLREYLDYLQQNVTRLDAAMSSQEAFWQNLYDGFGPERNRQSMLGEDVKSCPIDRYQVCKTRGHLVARDLADSNRQIALIEFIQHLEQQYSKYKLVVFARDFSEYAQKRSIQYMSIYYILVTIASAAIVAVFFVPHLVLIFWIIAVLMSEIIALVGILPYIGVELDHVSLTFLIINVGYVVDFIMHLSFDFMNAPGKTRQDKVVHALTDVGHALIPAGLGTVMSVMATSTTGMYIYEVVFRSLSLAVGVSALHSCCFMPVFLSFFGPMDLDEVAVSNDDGDDDDVRVHKRHQRQTDRPLFNLMTTMRATANNSDTFFGNPVSSKLSAGGALATNVVYLAQTEPDEPASIKWSPPIISTTKNSQPSSLMFSSFSSGGVDNRAFEQPAPASPSLPQQPEENDARFHHHHHQRRQEQTLVAMSHQQQVAAGHSSSGSKLDQRRRRRASDDDTVHHVRRSSRHQQMRSEIDTINRQPARQLRHDTGTNGSSSRRRHYSANPISSHHQVIDDGDDDGDDFNIVEFVYGSSQQANSSRTKNHYRQQRQHQQKQQQHQSSGGQTMTARRHRRRSTVRNNTVGFSTSSHQRRSSSHEHHFPRYK